MDVVSHDAGGCLDAACGVNVYYGEKRDPNDLFCCLNYLLYGLTIQDGAFSKPDSDAAAQDALDMLVGAWPSQLSQKVETLLSLLRSWC